MDLQLIKSESLSSHNKTSLITMYKNRMEILENEMKSIEARDSELKRDNRTLNTKILEIQMENSDIKDSFLIKERIINKQRINIRELNRDLNTKNDKIVQLDSEIKYLKSENSILNELKNDVTRLKNESNDLKRKLDEKEIETRSLKNINQMLNDKCKILEEELTKKGNFCNQFKLIHQIFYHNQLSKTQDNAKKKKINC